MNVSGQLALAPGYPGWNRFLGLLRNKYDQVYFLSEVEYTNASKKPLKLQQSDMDALTSRFGLRSNQENCLEIQIRGLTSQTITVAGTGKDFSMRVEPHQGRFILACPAEQAPSLRDNYLQRVEAADVIFDRITTRCPEAFLPARTPTVGGPGDWRRLYAVNDSMLRISKDVVSWSHFRASAEITIAAVDDVLANAFAIDCALK